MNASRLAGLILLGALPHLAVGQDKGKAAESPTKKTADSPELDKLRARLQSLEEEARKIHQEMSRILDRDRKKAEEAVEQAMKEVRKALTDRDRDALAAAQDKLRRAQQRRSRLVVERARLRGPFMGWEIAGPPRPDAEQRLGIQSTGPSPVLLRQLGLDAGVGRVIRTVRRESAAAEGGLREHDVILEIAGKTVPSGTMEFRKLLDGRSGAFDVLVLRGGKRLTLKGLKFAE